MTHRSPQGDCSHYRHTDNDIHYMSCTILCVKYNMSYTKLSPNPSHRSPRRGRSHYRHTDNDTHYILYTMLCLKHNMSYTKWLPDPSHRSPQGDRSHYGTPIMTYTIYYILCYVSKITCHTQNDYLIHLIEAPEKIVAIIGAHLRAVVAHASFQHRRVPIDMSLTICHALHISCTIWCIHDMSYTILFRAVVAHASFQRRRVPIDMSLAVFHTLYFMHCMMNSPCAMYYIILRSSSTCVVSAQASIYWYVTRYISYTKFHTIYDSFTVCHTLYYTAQ